MGLGTHTQHMYAYTHCKHAHTHTYASLVPYTYLCHLTPIHTCTCSYAHALYRQYNTNYITHIYTHPKTDAHLINNYIRIRRHACNGTSK